MSQHSDLLTRTISRSIRNGFSADYAVDDFIDLLETLEYDEFFTDHRTAIEHMYVHARWMITQSDGLYGISHAKLDTFITELWCKNQWLSA